MKVAAGLRAMIVMQTAVGHLIQPDAGEQIKLLIGCDTLTDSDKPLRRNIPCQFLTRLKRRDWSPAAACRTMVAVFEDG